MGYPLALITAFIRRGIDSIRPWIVSIGIRAHSSWRTRKSSFLLLIFRRANLRFSTFHKCSIGLRSGLWAGHFMTGMLTRGWRNQRLTIPAVCFGSPSCWNSSNRTLFLFQYDSRAKDPGRLPLSLFLQSAPRAHTTCINKYAKSLQKREISPLTGFFCSPLYGKFRSSKNFFSIKA